MTDADNKATAYTFDPAGQQTLTTRADATTTRTDFNADGTVLDQVNGAGATTSYAYDAQARVATTTTPPTSTNPAGITTTMGYDPAGNLVAKADPGGTCPAWPITYPPTLSPSARCTVYGYDAANELTSTTYSDGVTPNVVSIAYDADGQRKTMTDGTGTSTWGWDSLHRLTTTTSGAGATIGYGHDLVGHTTSTVYPGATGTVTRTFDAAGRMATLSDWASHQTSFVYNADSALVSEVKPNGTTVATGYDSAGAQSSVAQAPTSTPGSPLASLTYTRDPANQLASVASTGLPPDNSSFGYTSINQLGAVGTSSYGYDPAGNPTTLANGATQSFDAASQLHTAAGPTPALTANFGYDAKGERTLAEPGSGGWAQLGYDQAGRLATAAPTSPAGTYAAAVNADHPAVLWRLDQSSSADPVVDASGQQHTGSLHNPANITPGQGGPLAYDPATAFAFNGSEAWVRTPQWAGAQNNGSFTDEVWATRPANLAGKSPGDPSLPALMGQGGSTASTGGGWRVVVNPDATFTYFRDNHTWTSTSPIPATGYHHIAITYDGTTLRYYLDGAAAGTFTTSLSTVTDTGDLQVGNSNDNVDPDFDQGNLADVAIYTSALTAAQVSAHHTAGVTAPGTSTNYAGAVAANSPALFWRLGDAVGSMAAADSSGHGLTGTVNSTTGVTFGQAGPLVADTTTAVAFAGQSPEWIRVAETASLQNNGGFTDEVWATRPANLAGKSPGDPSLPALMGQGGSTGAAGGGWRVVVNPDATFTYFRDNHTWASTSPIPATGYHHIAITYDGTTLRYYLDGAAAGTFTTSLSTVTDTGDLQVGNSNDNVDPDFDQGNLADVAIYTTALTAAQVSAHHTAGVSQPSTQPAPTYAYAYNGDGLRTSKAAAGTTTTQTWDPGGGLPQVIADGTTSYIYGPDGLPLEQVSPTGTLYYLQDQLGSTRALTDASGNLVATYTYDAYGTLTASTGAARNPFGYAGEWTDAETGFIYLRARYYDPATAQFLTRDPLVALSGSAYGYVDDNPLNGTDPTGLFCLLGHVHGRHGACRGTNVTHDAATVGFVVGVAAVVVGTIAAPEIVLPLVGAVETEGLSVGLGVAATGIGAYVTAADCNRSVDAQCVMDAAGTVLGAASVVGALGAATGSALDAASPELAEYIRGLSNLGFGIGSNLYSGAGLFVDQLGLTSPSEQHCAASTR